MNITRRSFARYLSHSMIAAAFYRVMSENGYAASGGKRILIAMNPNGHMDFNATRDVFQKNMDPAVFSKYGLFVKGLKNATNTGDWHGGEGAFLSFGTNGKNGTASFFSTLGADSLHLNAIGVQGIYARDSKANAMQVFSDPNVALKSVFGVTGNPINSTDTAAIEAGKKSIIDPCLSDVKGLQSALGSDGKIFGDYMEALVALEKKTKSVSQEMMMPVVKAEGCEKGPILSGGAKAHDVYKSHLELAQQVLACGVKQIITLGFGDNQQDPFHNTIHSNSYNDGGKSYADWVHGCMGLTSAMVSKIGTTMPDLFNDCAVIYLSEGGAHMINGKFEHAHPPGDIPCAVFGKLGGAFAKQGMADANGGSTANLYRQILDGLSDGKADLATLKATGIKSLGI